MEVFLLLEKKVLNYIKDYNEAWETGPLPKLVKEKQLLSYQTSWILATNGYFKRKINT